MFDLPWLKRLPLRYIPELSFVYDESVERSEKIASLLNQVAPDQTIVELEELKGSAE